MRVVPARLIWLRGDAPSSPLLVALVRRAVESSGIRPAAVGAITTLCWLHHSLSGAARDDALAVHAPGEHQPLHGLEGVAEAWLADPALGTGWSCWRTS